MAKENDVSRDAKYWLEKIEKFAWEFKNVPKELVTEEFCLAAVRQNGWALKYVPEALKAKIRAALGT